MATTATTKAPKADAVLLAAQTQARQAAEEQAGDWGVGEWLGAQADSELTLTHSFACPHPGYIGWRWTVSMARVPRARAGTVTEVDLMPGDASLLAPAWVPWAQRIQPGDVRPGMVLPTPETDPRLEPGFTGGELAADEDPAEWAATRAVVAELGLGRERVLSHYGRTAAAMRWLRQGGPDDQSSRLAPGECVTCGYFVRLSGALGNVFGVCANEYSPSDGRVVSVDHGCGGHSDTVVEPSGEAEMSRPVFDTVTIDHPMFD